MRQCGLAGTRHHSSLLPSSLHDPWRPKAYALAATNWPLSMYMGYDGYDGYDGRSFGHFQAFAVCLWRQIQAIPVRTRAAFPVRVSPADGSPVPVLAGCLMKLSYL